MTKEEIINIIPGTKLTSKVLGITFTAEYGEFDENGNLSIYLEKNKNKTVGFAFVADMVTKGNIIIEDNETLKNELLALAQAKVDAIKKAQEDAEATKAAKEKAARERVEAAYSDEAARKKAAEDFVKGNKAGYLAAKKRLSKTDLAYFEDTIAEAALRNRYDQVYVDTYDKLTLDAKKRKGFIKTIRSWQSHKLDLSSLSQESLDWIKENLTNITVGIRWDVHDDENALELFFEELDREYPQIGAMDAYKTKEGWYRGSAGNGFVATFREDAIKSCPKELYELQVTKTRLFATADQDREEVVPLFGDTRIKYINEVSCNQFVYALFDLGYKLGKNGK